MQDFPNIPAPDAYAGQRVAVLGLGRSGVSAARLLARHGAIVTVLDSGNSPALAESGKTLEAEGISVALGERAVLLEAPFDWAVLSPGIDPAVPMMRNFIDRRPGLEIIGELELGYRHCAAPIVAITGTNGKTTTTELTTEALNFAGKKAVAAGNIGLPLSEVAADSANLDWVVVEVSSFQLETITSFRPRIAVWTNFTADHLDRYPNMGEYREAKEHIWDYMQPDDLAIIPLVEERAGAFPHLKARVITHSVYQPGATYGLKDNLITRQGVPVLDMGTVQLAGIHNAENMALALALCEACGLTADQIVPALQAYRPRPHRCEKIRELDGVLWLNDSKSTNLDSLEKALSSQTRPVVLIAGGKDKGFEFEKLANLVQAKVRDSILIGEMQERIAAVWPDLSGGPAEHYLAQSLADAVAAARGHAQPGDVVLFSPGTSSFDMFTSYVDRGNQFRELVLALE